VTTALCGVEKFRRDIPGRTRTRCELSKKPAVSKAGPIGRDLKAIVLYNMVAILSMAFFAVLGLAVASAAASAAAL
jgi:hypothetical protein